MRLPFRRIFGVPTGPSRRTNFCPATFDERERLVRRGRAARSDCFSCSCRRSPPDDRVTAANIGSRLHFHRQGIALPASTYPAWSHSFHILEGRSDRRSLPAARWPRRSSLCILRRASPDNSRRLPFRAGLLRGSPLSGPSPARSRWRPQRSFASPTRSSTRPKMRWRWRLRSRDLLALDGLSAYRIQAGHMEGCTLILGHPFAFSAPETWPRSPWPN